MSTFNSNIHGQSTQHKSHKSSSPQSEIAGDNDSGFLNARRVRCDLSTCFAGMFAAVKEYFWPAQTDVTAPALTGRAIDVESASECGAEQGHPELGSRCGSTIKGIVLAAAAAGIAATAWWVRSALCTDGDAVGPNGVTPGALSAALATTALIGRRLLSAPTVVNAIANQSVYANTPFNLQIDLSRVFSWSGSLADIHFSQADGAPLPSGLTMTITPVSIGSTAISWAADITVIGDYAIIAGWTGGLKILDITNKTSPILVGSTSTSSAVGLTVVGNYAFIADSGHGLKIIDITSKTNPILVGSIYATYNTYRITVVGNYAYVADPCNGLSIVDVSNKTNPFFVKSAEFQGAQAIAIVDNYAYVACRGNGLKVLDITNRVSPVLVGSATTFNAGDVTVVGNYAYVADNAAGLKIFDVSNKANPILVGSAATSANNVIVIGNYAYVTASELKIIDISNKASPNLVGSGAASSDGGFSVVGNYAYVAKGCNGLEIFSLTYASLLGIPSPLNRGTLPIRLTITDTLGETASAYFSITVLNNPPIAPTIEPQTVHHAFNWVIPEFSDRDGDAVIYSATLADGSPLPSWISFDSTTRTLSGIVPPVVTVRKINIQANDLYGGTANATQTITIFNNPPIIGPGVLPNQNVKQEVPFNFSLDSNVCIDPDGDYLNYSASLANQQPLPNWLTFNQNSQMFTVTAPVGTGSMSVIVTATDLFGAAVSRSFDLNVAGSGRSNTPPVKVFDPPNFSVGIDKQIAFQVSNNTFFDADNDPLTWSASTVNGSALPAWLNFEGDTRFFYGIAPNIPQLLPLTVQAEDWQHIPATANFNLLIEGGPQTLAPLSNLVATVGTAFKFVVPKSTFQDLGIQDAMVLSAALTTDAPLPAWLIFDPATSTFTGTPTRKDTDAFSSRPLPIRLVASNSFGTASVDFIISVQGESDATLAIKIISGIGAALLIGSAGVKRKSIWKKSMKCVFRLPTEYVTFGQESEYCHPITRLNPDQVASVQLLRDGQSLPGGVLLPDWLVYSPNARITIDAGALKDQDGLKISRWTVQVKNKGGYVNGLVWEEFDIKFVKQLPDANVDNESRDSGVAMQSSKSRRDQLHQPLIGAP